MKLSLGIVLVVACALFFYAKFYRSAESSIESVAVAPVQLAISASSLDSVSSSSLSADQHLSGMAGSSVVSGPQSLSGARVDPLSEVAFFLRQMDNANVPRLYLPTPKQNANFNYAKATPVELKDQALAGDPFAAYRYAEIVVQQRVRVKNDKGGFAYNPEVKKRDAAMGEAREFYVRALQGGIKSAATVLSKFYEDTTHGGSRIESLAWHKIAFALGESERYDCLRNSTTCAVKDFNNLNRVEYFYPCLTSSGDGCTQEEYDAAMLLAFQYADSLEFALHNKVAR